MNSRGITTLIAHNTWATSLLLDDAATLSVEQFHQRFEIGPGSLHDTLRHIIGAMRRWADRIGGAELRPSIEQDDRHRSPAELMTLLTAADAQLRTVAEALDASDRWLEPMEFQMPDGPTYRFQRLTAMLHALTHGMHHRAQALNIRRQLGLPPIGYDLDVVEWECVQTGQLA